MPYTPPSASPIATHPHSRAASRSASFSTPPSSTTFAELNESAPTLTPRSAAYLTKHRRAQSAAKSNNSTEVAILSPTRSSGPLLQPPRSSSSLHQSPSPVSNASMIPTGAVISPPDSSQNSSDDESLEKNQKRGRQLVNLAELEEAIRCIPQRKQPSPDRSTAQEDVTLPEPKSPEMLSAAIHNKISHQRASSDSYMRDFGKQLQQAAAADDDDDSDEDEDGNFIAPPMVRKKSGELVKSSLKTPYFRRRPSSMPSTPTYPKAVHFDQHLEHVRHFLHSEKPLAVSAGSSPVESAIEYDAEYPFPTQDFRQPSFEWEIGLPNFPDKTDRSSWVCRVEKVILSHDNKSLLGTVAVANVSYQKLVVARFTVDYWQTTSEVVAEYNNDIRKKQSHDGCDRFTFKIKLDDLSNLENKMLFFCVRYRVGDQEFWDNNCAINYQVDFKKKAIMQNGKAQASRMSLPRSRPSVSMAPRPRSVPSFDDSFDAFDPRGGLTSSTKVRLAAPASDVDEHEAPPARRANPSGNAFGNRYDFESSLAAAITTAAKVLGPERSGLSVKAAPNPVATRNSVNPYFRVSAAGDLSKQSLPRSHSSPALTPMPKKVEMKVPRLEIKTPTPEPVTLPKAVNAEDKPSIESSSYRELLDNYCFFGSAKPSPLVASGGQMPEKLSVTHIEGFFKQQS